MLKKENIKCQLCLGTHKIDNTGWVQSCQGYISLGDFEMIVKYNTGESVEYVK